MAPEQDSSELSITSPLPSDTLAAPGQCNGSLQHSDTLAHSYPLRGASSRAFFSPLLLLLCVFSESLTLLQGLLPRHFEKLHSDVLPIKSYQSKKAPDCYVKEMQIRPWLIQQTFHFSRRYGKLVPSLGGISAYVDLLMEELLFTFPTDVNNAIPTPVWFQAAVG